jgi:hypothetical protein
LFEHDLFGKPLHTFPDHALAKDAERIELAHCPLRATQEATGPGRAQR